MVSKNCYNPISFSFDQPFFLPANTSFLSIGLPAATLLKCLIRRVFLSAGNYLAFGQILPLLHQHFLFSVEGPGSTLVCQLPGAYRRLPRLSSPLDAKTSTMHP
jgi:hypothetical protein